MTCWDSSEQVIFTCDFIYNKILVDEDTQGFQAPK